jgi:hypothetical protein
MENFDITTLLIKYPVAEEIYFSLRKPILHQLRYERVVFSMMEPVWLGVQNDCFYFMNGVWEKMMVDPQILHHMT